MSLEDYARRFRIQNPTVPEQYYGRLAKFENLVQLARAEPEGHSSSIPHDASTPAVLAATSSTPAQTTTPTPDSNVACRNPPIKLSLRRESSTGASWVPALQIDAPVNLATSTTKNVTESAMSFLSGIRASFRQTPSAARPTSTQTQPEVLPIVSTIPVNQRASIQSSRTGRGRGKKSTQNE